MSWLKDELISHSPVKPFRCDTHTRSSFSSAPLLKVEGLGNVFLDTYILDFNVTKAKERRGRNKEVVMKKRLVTAGEKKGACNLCTDERKQSRRWIRQDSTRLLQSQLYIMIFQDTFKGTLQPYAFSISAPQLLFNLLKLNQKALIQSCPLGFYTTVLI